MRIFKWLFLLALLAAGGYFAFKHYTQKPEPPRVIATAEAGLGNVRKVLEATGIIKAQVGAIVKIGARATGTIKEMNVKVGDEVKRDQLIAVIDSRELRSQLDEAEARLARANAELSQVETVYPRRIAEAEAELRLSQAKYDYAASTLKRQDELFRKELVARDVLDAARRDNLVS